MRPARLAAIAAAPALAVLLGAAWPAPQLDTRRYLDHVRYLSSPELRGRGAGTPELANAASYIARQFQQAGLAPPAPGGFLQPFSITLNARLGRRNRFSFVEAGRKSVLICEKQFIPFSFSRAGKFEGHVVFAGYGITAPEYNYDDYAAIDVRGKFVLILRHEPQEFDEQSVFAGRVYTGHSQLATKAQNASAHGAKGVIFINDTGNHSGADLLDPFTSAAGPAAATIPFVQLEAAIAAHWLAARGADLKTIQAAIDKDLQPRGFDLGPQLTIELYLDLHHESRTVNNVITYLPGETPEHIVIGAHYDHLGLGEQFSMAPSQAGTPHPGADDNASGAAGVIEMARLFAARPKPRRGIVFICFAGEELGLLGSLFYVNHPAVPIENAVAMINLDMIGRIRDHNVFLGGSSTGTGFAEMIQDLARSSPLHLEVSDQTGYGSSDHTSFTAKEVPVLFFFSGLHPDYHKPSDTWDKIDGPETLRLLEVVARAADRLISTPERPRFVRLASPARPVAHVRMQPSR